MMTNIAMECHGIDGPFINGLPIINGGSFHGYVSHNQRVALTARPQIED